MSVQPTGRDPEGPCSSSSLKADRWRIPSHLGMPAFLFYSGVQCIYIYTHNLVALFLWRTLAQNPNPTAWPLHENDPPIHHARAQGTSS